MFISFSLRLFHNAKRFCFHIQLNLLWIPLIQYCHLTKNQVYILEIYFIDVPSSTKESHRVAYCPESHTALTDSLPIKMSLVWCQVAFSDTLNLIVPSAQSLPHLGFIYAPYLIKGRVFVTYLSRAGIVSVRTVGGLLYKLYFDLCSTIVYLQLNPATYDCFSVLLLHKAKQTSTKIP